MKYTLDERCREWHLRRLSGQTRRKWKQQIRDWRADKPVRKWKPSLRFYWCMPPHPALFRKEGA